MFDHAEVVGHKQVGQSEPFLQLEHEVQDLRLHRDVERRDRLVGDDQTWIQCRRAGDPDSLTLAATERVRIAAHVLGPKADEPQELCDSVRALAAIAHPVHFERLADDFKQRHARVE